MDLLMIIFVAIIPVISDGMYIVEHFCFSRFYSLFFIFFWIWIWEMMPFFYEHEVKIHLHYKKKTSLIYFFSISGLIVHGPSGPLVAPLGSSVVLPCYVDELLLMEGLKVEWRRTDSETVVQLYQDGESRAESQQQDYHDRTHFFTDQIQHGNFSLRLDNLRPEDEGRYTCRVYSQQDSGETVVEIKHGECEPLTFWWKLCTLWNLTLRLI